MHGEIKLGARFTDAQLPNGDFNSLTTTLALRVTPNTKLSYNSLAQYDNQSEDLGLNHRLRYILKPGGTSSVYNQGYRRTGSRFESFKDEAITKLGWTFQF